MTKRLFELGRRMASRARWPHLVAAAAILVVGAAGAIGASLLTRTSAPSVASCGCGPLADPSDLPLVVVPALHAGRTMAVLISGDGGWRAIDRNIADGLAAHGVPVVGLVSPSFFGRRKSEEEAACALRRIIEYYSILWHAPNVLVGGYSRGAGVAPFMVARLPARWRAHVRTIALIALEPTIDFSVTPHDLFRTGAAPGEIPVAPEIMQLRGIRVLCIYGVRDTGSLCRDLSPLLVVRVPEPGGHHFAGSYDELTETMLRLAARGQPARLWRRAPATPSLRLVKSASPRSL